MKHVPHNSLDQEIALRLYLFLSFVLQSIGAGFFDGSVAHGGVLEDRFGSVDDADFHCFLVVV